MLLKQQAPNASSPSSMTAAFKNAGELYTNEMHTTRPTNRKWRTAAGFAVAGGPIVQSSPLQQATAITAARSGHGRHGIVGIVGTAVAAVPLPARRVDSNFQVAIWPVLAVAQFFAMMPICGIRCRRRINANSAKGSGGAGGGDAGKYASNGLGHGHDLYGEAGDETAAVAGGLAAAAAAAAAKAAPAGANVHVGDVDADGYDDDDYVDESMPTSNLHFRWFSMRVVWTLLYMLVGCVVLVLYWKRLHETGITAKNIGYGIYFCNSLLFTCIFFRLVKHWPTLIGKWTRVERPFLRAPYHRVGTMSLPVKIRLTALCLFMLTACDLIIYTAQSIVNYRMRMRECKWADKNHLQRFFTIENVYLFMHIPYSIWIAMLKMLFDLINMMGGSYGTFFMTLLCIGVSTRFRQIAERLRVMNEGTIPESTWAEVRVHYAHLCELLEAINNTMAPVILLSCANNLYFICFQLLNCFDKFEHYINYCYYWYSLIYLMIRTVGLFLSAAAISDAAWAPVEIIRSVPSTAWGVEVERFFNQIVGERPALTGMKFFQLTRNNLLAMTGTIITYELVLMQFSERTKLIDAESDRASQSCKVWIDY